MVEAKLNESNELTVNVIKRNMIELSSVQLCHKHVRQSLPSLLSDPFPQFQYLGLNRVFLNEPLGRFMNKKQAIQLKRKTGKQKHVNIQSMLQGIHAHSKKKRDGPVCSRTFSDTPRTGPASFSTVRPDRPPRPPLGFYTERRQPNRRSGACVPTDPDRRQPRGSRWSDLLWTRGEWADGLLLGSLKRW